jgi:nitroimidazol reductase NimA-like FMN-containing flavoprotein (pyridoxamine 5'-phosphate oxidase superfamily)
LGRLATVSRDGVPHVVPVCYVFQERHFVIATDYGTRKYRNILANEKVAFLVDVYRPNRGVLVQGAASVLERGFEFQEAYRLFYRKFSWVRADPWKEGEAPLIRIEPTVKSSWGLK